MIPPPPIFTPLFVPVKVNESRVPPVKVLLVNVCEPDKVTTLLVVLNVTVLLEAADVISVPPASVNVSLSKSIGCDVPLSGAISKSCTVTCASTYALMDCCVAIFVALLEFILSSSRTADPLNEVFKTGVVSVAVVKVLFVNVCEPTKVATVLAILYVIVLLFPTESIPVPPVSVNVSESIVICPLPLSVAKTKSISVSISLSTYALILCCEAIAVAELLDIVS